MQGENDVRFVRVEKVPCELVVAGFVNEYSQYLEQERGVERTSRSTCYMLLRVTSWLMILVGVFTIMFGPETLSYSSQTGPTFLQLIQIYPGAIVSIGALLFVISKFFDCTHSGTPLTPERFLLVFYELQLPEEPGISIAYVQGSRFQITRD
ncbi:MULTISPECIES: hypothetical protein [Pseudomonas]|uniref:Uncharacterized protein n=1 Tax=Pseudomonas cichorii TaxID=36746 RepID=A0A3M4WAB5_PSECI|nr:MULTISPECIES: hypothetical protein [Pseudomonas]RMR60996.1 hypothetical protein ALP84_03799 [Pseudomonas cichorii]